MKHPETSDVGFLIELAGQIELEFLSWNDAAVRLTDAAYFVETTSWNCWTTPRRLSDKL